ncbi:MAG: hypothetical protein V4608_00820 [Bacteroidota bacterium]
MKKYTLKYSIFGNIALILVLLFLPYTGVSAAETPKLNLAFTLKIKNGDLKNSLITIGRTNEEFIVLSPELGEDHVELPLGFEYVITFSKPGYASKSVSVDTHVPENRELREFLKQMFMIELEKLPGNNTEPVNRIAYSMKIGDFDFVRVEAKTVKTPQIAAIPESKATTSEQMNDSKTEQGKVTKRGGKIKEKRVIQEDTKKITIIIVTINDKEHTYKKEEFSWGTYFYKNGLNITGETFTDETEYP